MGATQVLLEMSRQLDKLKPGESFTIGNDSNNEAGLYPVDRCSKTSNNSFNFNKGIEISPINGVKNRSINSVNIEMSNNRVTVNDKDCDKLVVLQNKDQAIGFFLPIVDNDLLYSKSGSLFMHIGKRLKNKDYKDDFKNAIIGDDVKTELNKSSKDGYAIFFQ